MKTTLYYFSSTGNSLKVARELAAALGETDVVPIPVAVKGEVRTEADVVGIVFPVYVFGLPNIVAEFSRKLQVKPGAYVFGVTTFGGMPGASMKQLRSLLAEKGVTLQGGWGVRMPGNYTPLYGAPPDEAQQKQFAQVPAQVAGIAAAVKARQPGPFVSSNALVNFFFHTLLYTVSMPRMGGSDKKFFVQETCNRCGLCEKVCPVQNIRLVDGRPAWQHRCEQCMACLQWCPQEAIQFGKATIGRRRYRHPEFKAEDFMVRG